MDGQVGVRPVKDPQALGDVVHADALSVGFKRFRITSESATLTKATVCDHADAIILHFDAQTVLRLQATAEYDTATFNLGR